MLEKLRQFVEKKSDDIEQRNKTLRELHMFGVKDNKSDEFNQPFFQPHPATAIRVFRAEINRADTHNMLYLYPEEFDLYYLGAIDLLTGDFTPNNERLMNGRAVKQEPTK